MRPGIIFIPTEAKILDKCDIYVNWQSQDISNTDYAEFMNFVTSI